MAQGIAGVPAQATPRGPGLFNAGVAGLVVSLVAAIAMTASQEPPPTVAEFAPQAVEQIKQSLPEQADPPDTTTAAADGEQEEEEEEAAQERAAERARASERARQREEKEENKGGNEDGPGKDGPNDDGTPDPGATEPERLKPEDPRVRKCVGDPPRQTEDPQSPPCVPFFKGDNGGSTWKGVNANTIRISIPRNEFFGAPDDVIQDFIDHFNSRYEFYGRKIEATFYNPKGGTFAHPVPQQMIDDAILVDTQHKSFASIAYPDRKGSEHHYYDGLAERGIISSAYRAQARASEEEYAKQHPHEWNLMPAIETILLGVGDMVCQTLAGDAPQGGGPAGDGQQTTAPVGGQPQTVRTFGLIYAVNTDGVKPPIEVLKGRLDSCGVKLAAEAQFKADTPDANALTRMEQADVTTVIYLGEAGALRGSYMQQASTQQYFPEWLVTSYIDNDVDNTFQPGNAPPEQARNVLGVSFRNKILPRQNMPWYWAVREQSPEKDPKGGVYYPASAAYGQLLQLASGIQLAGPNLTPETFAAGMQQAQFPNPDAGKAPYYQAPISYDGKHTAFDTAMLFFYSPQTGGTADRGVPGSVCYVNEGARYPLGGFPDGKQEFFGPCR